jgi:proline iminopeptidase
MSIPSPSLHEGAVPVEGTELFFRETGQGRPIVVLHGGPDFDHTYLLPELDRLSDAYRLIYYDQRGRGRSVEGVQPEDVTIASEVADLERLQRYFQLDTVALLGHSWGCLLALEYALRHPQRVSHLILLNTAPASAQDYLLLRRDRLLRSGDDIEKLKVIRSEEPYQQGDPDAVAAYYRVHFRAALRKPEHLESIIQRLRASFTSDGILKARRVEDRLMEETWLVPGYNLLPQLEGLHIPTLVIHGEHDFVPALCAEHVAQAIPDSRFALLSDCGHFSYLECPDEVRREIDEFLTGK